MPLASAGASYSTLSPHAHSQRGSTAVNRGVSSMARLRRQTRVDILSSWVEALDLGPVEDLFLHLRSGEGPNASAMCSASAIWDCKEEPTLQLLQQIMFLLYIRPLRAHPSPLMAWLREVCGRVQGGSSLLPSRSADLSAAIINGPLLPVIAVSCGCDEIGVREEEEDVGGSFYWEPRSQREQLQNIEVGFALLRRADVPIIWRHAEKQIISGDPALSDDYIWLQCGLIMGSLKGSVSKKWLRGKKSYWNAEPEISLVCADHERLRLEAESYTRSLQLINTKRNSTLNKLRQEAESLREESRALGAACARIQLQMHNQRHLRYALDPAIVDCRALARATSAGLVAANRVYGTLQRIVSRVEEACDKVIKSSSTAQQHGPNDLPVAPKFEGGGFMETEFRETDSICEKLQMRNAIEMGPSMVTSELLGSSHALQFHAVFNYFDRLPEDSGEGGVSSLLDDDDVLDFVAEMETLHFSEDAPPSGLSGEEEQPAKLAAQGRRLSMSLLPGEEKIDTQLLAWCMAPKEWEVRVSSGKGTRRRQCVVTIERHRGAGFAVHWSKLRSRSTRGKGAIGCDEIQDVSLSAEEPGVVLTPVGAAGFGGADSASEICIVCNDREEAESYARGIRELVQLPRHP